MAANGHSAVSLILARETWDLLDEIARDRACRSRREFLATILSWAEDELNLGALVLPPRRRRGMPVTQDKIMLPRRQLRFLVRIKAKHGLSRSDAIHALLLTMLRQSTDSGGCNVPVAAVGSICAPCEPVTNRLSHADIAIPVFRARRD